jgi:hypothetical protein
MRIVREFQQNFTGLQRRTWEFQFTKVYKQDPKNKLMIEVMSLASNDSTFNQKPHLFFLTGLPQLSAAASTNLDLVSLQNGTFTDTTGSLNPNDFFLGVLGGGLNPLGTARGDIWIISSPRIYVNDLPLSPFNIYYRHPDSVVNYTGDVMDGFFISFRITEYRED